MSGAVKSQPEGVRPIEELIERAAEEWGHNTTFVKSAREALTALLTTTPSRGLVEAAEVHEEQMKCNERVSGAPQISEYHFHKRAAEHFRALSATAWPTQHTITKNLSAVRSFISTASLTGQEIGMPKSAEEIARTAYEKLRVASQYDEEGRIAIIAAAIREDRAEMEKRIVAFEKHHEEQARLISCLAHDAESAQLLGLDTRPFIAARAHFRKYKPIPADREEERGG